MIGHVRGDSPMLRPVGDHPFVFMLAQRGITPTLTPDDPGGKALRRAAIVGLGCPDHGVGMMGMP